ncbi:MAG TPA: ABC transporter ATP-binding protein [Thermomicrobiales bacterium]|nr:ABC transporter ATP-binding protein [Thermomicrobiales bacterium]
MKILIRIINYLRPYMWWLIGVYAALLIALGLQLAIPQVLGRAIDHGIVDGDIGYVGRAALAIIVLAAFQAVFTFARSYGTNRLAEHVANDLRNELYDKFQELPWRFYDQAQSGQLMARATDDINNIRGMMMFSLRAIVQALGMLIIISVIVLRTNWILGLISLSTAPFLVWWSIRFSVTIRPLFLKVQQQFGAMTSTLQENVAGGRVVRAFAQERAESTRFQSELDELFKRNMRTARRWSFSFPMTIALNGLSVAGVIWVGGWMVLTGRISVGTLVVFERYTTMLQEPIRWLGFVVNRVARAIASGERIFEILDTKVSIRDNPGATPLENMRGVVEFHDVTFGYQKGGAPAIHNVTFEAHPGQITALVGPTGGGKSSVVSLIPRFYDPASGTVTIDGRDVREITLRSLRSQIGFVMQESFLFSMTVRENIAYGKPDASMEDIVAAAKAARAHDFIMRMEEGYNSVIGERGVSLSGGQKQRLAIARALLIDPRILILDDATASVDAETEHEIQEALRTLMHGRTSFVIAQRLTTVRDADQILVFEEGRITQRGTHEELLKEENGFYHELYRLQMQDQEVASQAIAEANVDMEDIPDGTTASSTNVEGAR